MCSVTVETDPTAGNNMYKRIVGGACWKLIKTSNARAVNHSSTHRHFVAALQKVI